LYGIGNLKLLSESKKKLAIVGSRRISKYGKETVERWMGAIVERGVVVVSGFMYGADQVAHKACVDCGGETVAVLGYGIDRKPSIYDVDLYEKILENNGLILSEYEGETEANNWTFPNRNRIVAGMSDGVFVVEAGLKSGSLITARWAMKYKVPLMALPGEVDNLTALGTNELIQKGKARMICTAVDLLTGLGGERSGNSSEVIELLRYGPISRDRLAKQIKLPPPDLSSLLAELEIDGEVEVIGEMVYLPKTGK
jgi:DNA processing protein